MRVAPILHLPLIVTPSVGVLCIREVLGSRPRTTVVWIPALPAGPGAPNKWHSRLTSGAATKHPSISMERRRSHGASCGVEAFATCPTMWQNRSQNALWGIDTHQKPERWAETFAGRPKEGNHIHITPQHGAESFSSALAWAKAFTEQTSVGRKHSQSTLVWGRNVHRAPRRGAETQS